MAGFRKETVKYTKLWDDGKLPTCKSGKFRVSNMRKSFKQSFSKRPKEIEVMEIVGPSGRRHAICREIEKRVFIEPVAAKVPRTSLFAIHWRMVKRYRLALYDLL